MTSSKQLSLMKPTTHTLIGVALLFVIGQSSLAQDSSVSSSQATYIDAESQSASEIIDALKPKPRYKTRGIRFNNTAETAKPAPFAYDSDQLSEQAKSQLKPLGEALNSDQLASFSFKIDGQTDATGPENYNLDLSKRRALSVGRHLYEAYGVNIQRLKLNGKGETELYDPAQPAAGINRRVEITTLVQ